MMTMNEATERTKWGTIDGVDVYFPVEVTNANIATMTFTVPADEAAKLLPGDAFEIVESGPGQANLVIAACDYIENPWGNYNEINFGLLARPKGSGPEVAGSFVYRMPVDQEFTCKAGNAVMGFPKTVEGIPTTYTATHVTFSLVFNGQQALTVTVPRAEPMGDPAPIEAATYSYLDGIAYETPLLMDMGTGFVDGSQVEIELGDGPVADELRSLGLPKAPDFCTWGEGLRATFQLGHPL